MFFQGGHAAFYLAHQQVNHGLVAFVRVKLAEGHKNIIHQVSVGDARDDANISFFLESLTLHQRFFRVKLVQILRDDL